MRIETHKYEGVNPNGTFSNGLGGAVVTEGRLTQSARNGGCGLDGCNCSPGHYISITKPRTEDGIVEGITVVFDNQEEMDSFLNGATLFVTQ